VALIRADVPCMRGGNCINSLKGLNLEEFMGFKEGDIVKLKSGGPEMTIEKIGQKKTGNEEFFARCVWFENDQSKDENFILESLILASEK